jgi:hypothetical protein
MGGASSTARDDRSAGEIPTQDCGRYAPTLQPETAEWVPGSLGALPEVDGALGRLVGDYLILDRLGRGGMGVVYRALQRRARRIVALKLIKAEWWGESTEDSHRAAEVRLRHEAEALAQLEHDHIVPIYDVGQVDGLMYFSMRLIRGRSLAAMVRSDGPLPPERAAGYLEPIARAVQYAHDRGVLHRDLKPGNIMVDADDRPYLIDLGLCKSLEATDYTSGDGRPLGTAEYMPPEQARGDKDVGFEGDVYGLGATLFTLVTGSPPFTGSSPAVVLRKVIDEEPAWPPERDQAVGSELKAICLKCLEKDPSRRFRSAGALAEALRRYRAEEPTGITLPGPWSRLARWVRRNPWRAAAVGLAVCTVMVAAMAWVQAARRASRTADSMVTDLPRIPLSDLPRKIRELEGYRGLVEPRLRALIVSSPDDPELRARVALALLPSEPSRAIELADRLLACGPEEHWVIREALRDRWAEMAPRLDAVLDDPRSDPGRRTRAATALIALDARTGAGTAPSVERAWSLLRLEPVPDPRVELLDWLVRSKVEVATLAGRLEHEPDPSVRRMLILGMAELGDGQPLGGVPPALRARLAAWYRDDLDSGIHSSLAYLLRRWGDRSEQERIDAERAGRPRDQRRWLVTARGQTMAVIDPADPSTPQIPGGGPFRRFAIATTETTIGQYRAYDPDYWTRDKERAALPHSDPDLAAFAVCYHDAAGYCNWLSRQEGLPPEQWCYVPGRVAGSLVLAPDSPCRLGYRLPTLQEWEYAARAGTTTDRYFGQSLGHAADYAWFNRNGHNHAEPVGRKRPNDAGLFDALGNVLELCDNLDPPHDPGCDCPAAHGADCRKHRLVSIRGGSFYQGQGGLTVAVYSKTLDRVSPEPENAWHYIGFRIARSEP